MTFIVGNEVLYDVHRGFRANKSTKTALQIFVESTQEAIEDKVNPTVIFLDLIKSCDVLNNTILLSKLNVYGIRGVTNSWFELYLSHQRQGVEIDNIKQGHMLQLKGNLNMAHCRGQFWAQYCFCYT
jgi:hypothetical protein